MPDRTLTHRNRDVNIMWLDQAACQDSSCVGGKVANLSRLAADNSVPPGFCLTTAAFREWANASDDSSEAFPHQLLEQLRSSYAEMGRRTGSETPSVALRSSAIDEDGRFASFAGQYETYLNLVGDDAVADAVMRCWLSTRSDRVTEYRERYGLSSEEIEMAVLVQQLVPADSSAVIFSANPVSGARDEIVINAVDGETARPIAITFLESVHDSQSVANAALSGFSAQLQVGRNERTESACCLRHSKRPVDEELPRTRYQRLARERQLEQTEAQVIRRLAEAVVDEGIPQITATGCTALPEAIAGDAENTEDALRRFAEDPQTAAPDIEILIPASGVAELTRIQTRLDPSSYLQRLIDGHGL